MPSYIILTIIEGVICGLEYSAEAMSIYYILNSLDTDQTLLHLLSIISSLALFYLIAGAFNKIYWHIINPKITETLHTRLHRELFLKAQTLDLSSYDDPEFYNNFVFVMDEADTRAIKVIEGVGTLINRCVAFSTLFTMLFTIDIPIAILIFVTSILTTIAWVYCNKLNFNLIEQIKPLQRKTSYINRAFHLCDYAKEIRTSDVSKLLTEDYTSTQNKLYNVQKRYGRKFFVMHGFVNNFLYIGLLIITVIRMCFKLIAGKMLLGEFAAGVNAILRVRRFFFDICQNISGFSEHSLYIERYRTFMEKTPSITSGTIEMPQSFETLELKHVSFSYPHASGENRDSEILNDVSLKITKGDKVAFVGYNGAGKTTLIKLIMRFYDPTNGQILWNGIDIRKFNLYEYRRKIGAVFQDFKLFATTIAENVLCSRYDEHQRSQVIEALNATDFNSKLDFLENGIHTQLTKEFIDDGVNFSGGEEQKIAIARAFVRPYDIIIMDEPSSALDPLAEYSLNKKIFKHCENSTVIFISHRLSITPMADMIYMFSNGRIVESGNHLELMSNNGVYSQMFNVQADNYRFDEDEKRLVNKPKNTQQK